MDDMPAGLVERILARLREWELSEGCGMVEDSAPDAGKSAEG